MKPIVYSAATPRGADAFEVEWPTAIEAHAPIAIADHPYLGAIARYSNIEPIELGVFAHGFTIAPDPELDRLLALVHAVGSLPRELAPRLLARSTLRHALHAFAPTGGPSPRDDDGLRPPRPVDPALLEERLRTADFRWIDPFALEGELARYLYGYGMYRFFHQENDAQTAVAHARSFLAHVTPSPLESIVALDSRAPWGDWFDPHSCSDRTLLLIDRTTREGAVLAFSHSD